MIPRLAINCFEAGEFLELAGRRAYESEFAFIGQYQQQILIGQQQELAAAVATAFPFSFSVSQIDAGQNTSVESKGMAVVNDKVVEIGLQSR